MKKNCVHCENEFILEDDDILFYQKIKVPPPTLCSLCRRIRRNSWLNDYILYNRECFLCNKNFISIYHKNNKDKVLCPKCFHGDGWNPLEYGIGYDEKKSFFEQFGNLLKNTPLLGIINDDGIASVNCLYNNDIGFAKNCTFCFVSWKMEDSYYCFYTEGGKNQVDGHCLLGNCEFVYESINIEQVTRSTDMYWSSSCTDCFFGWDLRGCMDCFMCFGLRNKQYYFKNQKYSKEEYQKILNSYKLHTRSGRLKAKEEFFEFISKKPRRFADLRNSVDCTGTDLIRSKNTKDSNFASYSQDSKYCNNGVTFTSCWDCSGGGETELAYECITPDHSYNSLGTNKSWKNRNVSYSMDTHSSEECFGCIGVKKGSYMILNKMYKKEEYFKIKEKIIMKMKEDGEYGEFIPTQYSPFCFNETRAQDEINISKEEVLSLGYRWQDEIQETKNRQTILQSSIPDNILDVSDTICNEILACLNCDRNYKILLEEWEFYKRMKLPIPEQCFFCRFKRRENFRNNFDLKPKQCDCLGCEHHTEKCATFFETFWINETRLLYCEKCYQQEIN